MGARPHGCWPVSGWGGLRGSFGPTGAMTAGRRPGRSEGGQDVRLSVPRSSPQSMTVRRKQKAGSGLKALLHAGGEVYEARVVVLVQAVAALRLRQLEAVAEAALPGGVLVPEGGFRRVIRPRQRPLVQAGEVRVHRAQVHVGTDGALDRIADTGAAVRHAGLRATIGRAAAVRGRRTGC